MTVFIVGAGFSLAANARRSGANSQLAKAYPLAADLGRECFNSASFPLLDVEAAFDAALQAGDKKPIQKLVKLIQAADYYLGWDEARDPQSLYGDLVESFPRSQFLSFNYDSLLEQVLLQRGLWNPRDGFGVPVETGDSPGSSTTAPSTVSVFHLHGSVLLYPEEFSLEQEPGETMAWIKQLKELRFAFDPDNLGHCFSPFSRVYPGPAYRPPQQRVIVPIPDKSRALRESYVKIVYGRALEVLRTSDRVIAIGYSFAPCDRSSYESLMQTVSGAGKRLWVVGPEARTISTRLNGMYRSLRVVPVDSPFEKWAIAGFELPQLNAA